MADVNLFLRFRRRGESRSEVKAVSRIQVGAAGGLRIVDPHTGASETLSLSNIEEMAIQPVFAPFRHSAYA